MIRRWLSLSPSLVLLTVAACGGDTPEPRSASRGQVENEIQRCLAEEQHGEAKGCWTYFMEKYADLASTAERTLAQEHLARSMNTGTGSAATNDAVAAAAKSEGLGRRMTPKSEPAPSAATGSDGFPSQTVAYAECYKGAQSTGAAESDLKALTDRCGAPCGMIPFSDVLSGTLNGEDEKVDSWAIELRNDRCYRFFAVGESSIEDLDAAVVDGAGDIVMRDIFPDRAPILGPEGPYCPTQAGPHKFVVAIAKGGGSFKFQVWQGPAQRNPNVL